MSSVDSSSVASSTTCKLSGGLVVASGLLPAGPNVWTVDGRIPQLKASDMPVRMTVLGLPLGKRTGKKDKHGVPQLDLLVYAPLYPTENLISEIKAQGTVAYIVAPSALHSTWVTAFKAAFPSAKTIGPASLKTKLPETCMDYTFPQLPKNWPASVVSVMSVPVVEEELVLVHKPSGALVVADLAYNFVPGGDTPLPNGIAMKAYLTLVGGYKSCSLPLTYTFLMDDAAATKAGLEKVLMQEFHQLIMCHGSIIVKGAKEALTKGTLAFVTDVAKERAALTFGREYVRATLDALKIQVSHNSHWLAIGMAIVAAGAVASSRRK